MFTCLIRYTVTPENLPNLKRYAQAWIDLIEKYGGIHHGYFLPGDATDNFPEASFSFPNIGKAGPDNIAVALFSFPDVETYEAYRTAVVDDEACKKITAFVKDSPAFLNYERTFLKPIFSQKDTIDNKTV